MHSATNNWLILCKAIKPALLLDPKHHYILVALGINLLNKPRMYCLSLKVIAKGSYLWCMASFFFGGGGGVGGLNLKD